MAETNLPNVPAPACTPPLVAPELLAALQAIGRIARALVAGGSFERLAERVLAEMLDTLGLTAAVVYLPHPQGRPSLHRAIISSADPGLRARDELSFDAEAWQLAVATGAPLVFAEPASWLVANPFEPAASYWLVLPLVSGGELAGVVIASAPAPVSLDPVGVTTLSSLGDLLSAGIAHARLRQQVERTEVERERMRLAAELHDGLAQDLALAVREIAALGEAPLPETARPGVGRLQEAVAAAHRVVRAGLEDLSVAVPLGGIHAAVQALCERFAARGVQPELTVRGAAVDVSPEATAAVLRVAHEALANATRHAPDAAVRVLLEVEPGELRLVVEDDGPGFDAAAVAGPGDGHFGLTIMRERARAAGGALEAGSSASGGARVALSLPRT
jgi:nitrate/nitrite-specific signal transduction histidine kinase